MTEEEFIQALEELAAEVASIRDQVEKLRAATQEVAEKDELWTLS